MRKRFICVCAADLLSGFGVWGGDSPRAPGVGLRSWGVECFGLFFFPGSRGLADDKPLVVIPYVKGVTEKVTRALKPYARVATKPDRNLRGILVKPKDRRGPHQNAGLVYQYECECDQVYIGETGRSIKTREKNTNGLLETWTKIIPVFQNTS